jgi:DNA repair exonuclease SbcCD ATPase subunit
MYKRGYPGFYEGIKQRKGLHMSDHKDTPESKGNSGNMQTQLKKKLMNSWDQMKQRYPIVRSMELVSGDSDKEEFLRTIDGLKSAEEIGAYFTLEPSEAHLIFSDLLQLGAIRFIEDAERLGYLKKQNLEIKQKFDFQMAEHNRLLGEELYLTKRIKEKKKSIAELKESLPELNKSLEEHELNLASLRQNYNVLWESNSELLGLGKDMKSREQQIKQAIEMLEAEFPKLLKKKTRVINKLKKTEVAQNQHATSNDKLAKRLLIYRDTVDEMRDYLEDAKFRIDDLIKDK